MDLVSGNKPWDPARDFEADYLDSPGNPRQEKYTEAIQNLFQARALVCIGNGWIRMASLVSAMT